MAVFPNRRQQPSESPRQARANVRKVTHGRLTWYDFTTLGEAELRYLKRNFPFHPLDLEDVRSTRQRPKLEDYENYLFTIFHVPFFDRRTRRLVQEEVDVFIGRDFFVTVHSGRLKILNDLFNEVRTKPGQRAEYMGKGAGFLLYESISRLFEHSFPMLDRVAVRINYVEREILEGNTREMTEELSRLKLEIINFRRIIRPQRALLQALENKKTRLLPANLEIYFDDVQDAVERTSDLLENYKEVIESLEDTNETFIQHRTNNVVKVLTVLSLVTLPGTTLAGVLSMNLKYPFVMTETTFYVVVAASVVVAVSLLGYMFYKRWL